MKDGSTYKPASEVIRSTRAWPTIPDGSSRRTNPDQCEVCHGTAGNAALKFLLRAGAKRPDRHLTLYRGKWYCPLCLDKARRGLVK